MHCVPLARHETDEEEEDAWVVNSFAVDNKREIEGVLGEVLV